MSLFLKDYCWFPISYGIKHKLILTLSLQTNSRFFSVLSCHLSLALLPTSFDTLALSLPSALIHAMPSGLTAIPVYWNHTPHLRSSVKISPSAGAFLILNSELNTPSWSSVNNTVKSPLIVWLFGSLVCRLPVFPWIPPETLMMAEASYSSDSQVPSIVKAHSRCGINVDWINFHDQQLSLSSYSHFATLCPWVSA